MNQFMKQAQAMQSKFAEMQKEMATREYEGSAGGGMVKVTIKGTGNMKNVIIDPSLLNKEEADMVGDLVVAAFNDAKKNMEEDSQGDMSKMMGGMQLPPGFKMPF
jgi:nucleoid-associated protein EbfC